MVAQLVEKYKRAELLTSQAELSDRVTELWALRPAIGWLPACVNYHAPFVFFYFYDYVYRLIAEAETIYMFYIGKGFPFSEKTGDW